MLLAAADDRPRERPALRLRRQPARAASATSKTRAAPRAARSLIARYGYHIRDYRLTPDGRCPSCAAAVPGPLEPGSSTGRSRRGRSFPERATNSEFYSSEF